MYARKNTRSASSRHNINVRVCSLFQRLLLTRENYVIQMIVMEVLKQVMKAAQEDLATEKRLKLKGVRKFPTLFLT